MSRCISMKRWYLLVCSQHTSVCHECVEREINSLRCVDFSDNSRVFQWVVNDFCTLKNGEDEFPYQRFVCNRKSIVNCVTLSGVVFLIITGQFLYFSDRYVMVWNETSRSLRYDTKTSAKLGGQYSFLTFVTWTYRISLWTFQRNW